MPDRIHPRLKIGDVSGSRVVEKLLPRDHTSNERVLVRCTECDSTSKVYAHNFRRSKSCLHCRKPRLWTLAQRRDAIARARAAAQ